MLQASQRGMTQRRPVPGQINIGEWVMASRPHLIDQREMIARAQQGDRQAMARLCADHEAYAHRLVSSWRGSRDFDDVVQQARLGIVEAVHSYNPDKRTRLITHLHWMIMKNLKRETRHRQRVARATLRGI